MVIHFRNMKLDRRLKCNLDVGFNNLLTNDFKGTKFAIHYKQDKFNIVANSVSFVIKMIYHKVQIACKYAVLIYLYTDSYKSMPCPNHHALLASLTHKHATSKSVTSPIASKLFSSRNERKLHFSCS